MNKTPSVFKPAPGTILYKAARRAIAIADDLNEQTLLDFNDTMVLVWPGASIDKVIMSWTALREDSR